MKTANIYALQAAAERLATRRSKRQTYREIQVNQSELQCCLDNLVLRGGFAEILPDSAPLVFLLE